MNSDVELPNGYLEKLVERLTDSNTAGFDFVGSHARGDANEYSDVDGMTFVTELAKDASERYMVSIDEESCCA